MVDRTSELQSASRRHLHRLEVWDALNVVYENIILLLLPLAYLSSTHRRSKQEKTEFCLTNRFISRCVYVCVLAWLMEQCRGGGKLCADFTWRTCLHITLSFSISYWKGFLTSLNHSAAFKSSLLDWSFSFITYKNKIARVADCCFSITAVYTVYLRQL